MPYLANDVLAADLEARAARAELTFLFMPKSWNLARVVAFHLNVATLHHSSSLGTKELDDFFVKMELMEAWAWKNQEELQPDQNKRWLPHNEKPIAAVFEKLVMEKSWQERGICDVLKDVFMLTLAPAFSHGFEGDVKKVIPRYFFLKFHRETWEEPQDITVGFGFTDQPVPAGEI
ncbi:hypothetical protein K504DRAFT_503328 [Pleomassaria siparia CBS 279.74]|uniref:Uncharacterized protein n=1 Tax=Pleomassaria siparia CBS 279.74 TaxID=1314801 RepID=A0A6G1K687_9PLEO|nr:hypothetical protein K504DRAFT_503328 [Pleomassaria siparia CBS 279.74]